MSAVEKQQLLRWELRASITVHRTLISRGIGCFSSSRTNKLSPNTGSAWQSGGLMNVLGGEGGACIHQTQALGQYWGMKNQHRFFFFFKQRLKHHSVGCRVGSISRGPDRHFSFVALVGKTASKQNFPERRRGVGGGDVCIQNKTVWNIQTSKNYWKISIFFLKLCF